MKTFLKTVAIIIGVVAVLTACCLVSTLPETTMADRTQAIHQGWNKIYPDPKENEEYLYVYYAESGVRIAGIMHVYNVVPERYVHADDMGDWMWVIFSPNELDEHTWDYADSFREAKKDVEAFMMGGYWI